jgi:cytochrome c-type biogenesis protein CcmH/NrfG
MLQVDGGLGRAALDAFDRAEKAGGDPRTIGVGRARALAAIGDRAGAQAALRRVLAIDPADPAARRFLGELGASIH